MLIRKKKLSCAEQSRQTRRISDVQMRGKVGGREEGEGRQVRCGTGDERQESISDAAARHSTAALRSFITSIDMQTGPFRIHVYLLSSIQQLSASEWKEHDVRGCGVASERQEKHQQQQWPHRQQHEHRRQRHQQGSA